MTDSADALRAERLARLSQRRTPHTPQPAASMSTPGQGPAFGPPNFDPVSVHQPPAPPQGGRNSRRNKGGRRRSPAATAKILTVGSVDDCGARHDRRVRHRRTGSGEQAGVVARGRGVQHARGDHLAGRGAPRSDAATCRDRTPAGDRGGHRRHDRTADLGRLRPLDAGSGAPRRCQHPTRRGGRGDGPARRFRARRSIRSRSCPCPCPSTCTSTRRRAGCDRPGGTRPSTSARSRSSCSRSCTRCRTCTSTSASAATAGDDRWELRLGHGCRPEPPPG